MIITTTLVVSCIIIFVLLYFFFNSIDDKRKWLNIIITLGCTPLFYFFIWYPISNIFIPYHHHKTFNQEAWTEAPGLRYEMIDHMIESKFLHEKSKEEVADLLGPVQWLSWSFEMNAYNPDAWNYGLGVLPGAFNETKEDVEIKFENNKVVDVVLTQSKFTYEPKKETPRNKKLDSINSLYKNTTVND